MQHSYVGEKTGHIHDFFLFFINLRVPLYQHCLKKTYPLALPRYDTAYHYNVRLQNLCHCVTSIDCLFVLLQNRHVLNVLQECNYSYEENKTAKAGKNIVNSFVNTFDIFTSAVHQTTLLWLHCVVSGCYNII
jgi:hypothetical protein